MQQLQPSLTFTLILFHIRHTHPSDYHMFGQLKEAMGGKKFRSVEEVHQAVREWLRTRPQEFFSRGICALPMRWRKCVERQGDFVEK
jgi:hypothetical protein